MRYVISKYDPDDDLSKQGKWTDYATVNGLARARQKLRKLESMGYDREVSISVDVHEDDWPDDVSSSKQPLLDIDVETGRERGAE
jgi:hypothetical protein